MANFFNVLDRAATASIKDSFDVQSYGAKGDGTTSDLEAFKACFSAAIAAGQADSTYYAEVVIQPGYYNVDGAPTQGGATKGNALIALPVMPVTGQKFVLVIRGVREATALWHWQQTSAQRSGAVLVSTTTTGTNDGTFGITSIIGGPTPEQGYGQAAALYSNMLVVADGVSFLMANNPTMSGLDLAGVAEMNIPNVQFMVNAVPGTVTAPTSSWQFGLRCPQNNNNDNSTIGSFSAEGMNYALIADEHLVANTVRCIYCVAAVEAGQGNSDTSHGMIINYLSAESCQVGLGAVLGGSPIKVQVNLLDWESGSGGFAPFAAINDPTDHLLGTVNVTADGTRLIVSGTNGYKVNSAQALRVYDTRRVAGAVAAPTVPATTVDLLNPFFRDAAVTLTGGVVTNVKVDGTSLGLTVGSFIVPTNKKVNLTYSSAPTWVWTLM